MKGWKYAILCLPFLPSSPVCEGFFPHFSDSLLKFTQGSGVLGANGGFIHLSFLIPPIRIHAGTGHLCNVM